MADEGSKGYTKSTDLMKALNKLDDSLPTQVVSMVCNNMASGTDSKITKLVFDSHFGSATASSSRP